jgi:hypothetical protein
MKEKLLEIIKTKPKQYPRIIKADAESMRWIDENSLIDQGSFVAHLRSAIFQETNVCVYGKIKKIKRFNNGFSGCGPAKVCLCTAESISANVSKTKKETDPARKVASNSQRYQTMLKKYGVPHNLQRPEVKEKLSRPKIDILTHKILSDRSWLENEYVVGKRTLVDIAAELGVYYSTVADYCQRHGFEIRQRSQYSLLELELSRFVQSLGVDVETNERKMLSGKEIDVYVPIKKLGIEINGLYWHSWNPQSGKRENKNKHLEKTRSAENAGISLLQFTDQQWLEKQAIVKSIIRSKLGSTIRIHARRCQFKEIDTLTARKFLDQNHLDGFAAASHYFALTHQDNIVQCISLGNKRFGDRQGSEIIRFATLIDHTVVGGLSKLLSHIRSTYTGSITTFCSRDISQAQSYQRAGFRLIRETAPGYFWTDGNVVISRQKAQHHNLKKWLSSYDPDRSETVNLFSAGYRRYWTSGNYYLEL